MGSVFKIFKTILCESILAYYSKGFVKIVIRLIEYLWGKPWIHTTTTTYRRTFFLKPLFWAQVDGKTDNFVKNSTSIIFTIAIHTLFVHSIGKKVKEYYSLISPTQHL